MIRRRIVAALCKTKQPSTMKKKENLKLNQAGSTQLENLPKLGEVLQLSKLKQGDINMSKTKTKGKVKKQ